MSDETYNDLPEQVIDNGDLKKYRTELPNLIFDLNLSVYAFRLYVEYKRVAGAKDEAYCEQGVRYLSKQTGMAMGMVTKAKVELLDHGLIAIEEIKTPKGMMDRVRLLNIWKYNFSIYSTRDNTRRKNILDAMYRSLCEHPLVRSSRELMRSRSEQVRSSRELKKELLKEPLNEPYLASPALNSAKPVETDYSTNGTHSTQEDDSNSPLPKVPQKGIPPAKRATKGKDTPVPLEGVLDAICLLCYGTKAAWDTNASSIRGCYNKLSKVDTPITIDKLRRFYNWWNTVDWRGKKGQKPAPYQVVAEWPVAMSDNTNEDKELLGTRNEDDRYDESVWQ